MFGPVRTTPASTIRPEASSWMSSTSSAAIAPSAAKSKVISELLVNISAVWKNQVKGEEYRPANPTPPLVSGEAAVSLPRPLVYQSHLPSALRAGSRAPSWAASGAAPAMTTSVTSKINRNGERRQRMAFSLWGAAPKEASRGRWSLWVDTEARDPGGQRWRWRANSRSRRTRRDRTGAWWLGCRGRVV